MQRYPYVQKAQRRAYSADAHRVVELGRWSGVSKESFELNLHRDRYQQIGMIAHQFKVTDTKSAIIIQRERSRQAILKKVRKDSDERLEAAAAARKQQDEERKQRIAEKVRLREEQNAVEEEERRIKAMKDEKARAQAQARLDEQKQKDAPDRETRLAAAEKDEEELEKKKRMREEHRKQLEDKERDKRAKAQEAKKEAPKVADTTQAQPEVQEEEVTFVQDTPTVARISTEVKTFNFEEMRTRLPTFPHKKEEQEVVKKKRVSEEVVDSYTRVSVEVDIEVEAIELEPDDERSRYADIEKAEDSTAPSNRAATKNPYADLPGQALGQKMKYRESIEYFDEASIVSTLPDQVAGWKTGYKFLLDLCGAGKKFTDAQRADLMHLDEKLLMRNKKALQKRNERRRVAALDERIGPLVASEKRLPYDEDSLCEVMKHLSLLRYPEQALKLSKDPNYYELMSNGDVCLQAVRALLSCSGLEVKMGGPNHNDRDAYTTAAQELFDQYAEQVDDFMNEFLRDPLAMEPRFKRKVDMYYYTASNLIDAYRLQREPRKAEKVWKKLKGTNTSVKQAYIRFLTSSLGGEEELVQAKEHLQTIPMQERNEIDHRNIISACASRQQMELAEEIFKLAPDPEILTQKIQRFTTAGELIRGYAESAAKLETLETPTDRAEHFLSGVRSLETRLKDFGNPVAWSVFHVKTVKELTRIYAEMPELNSDEMEVYATYIGANALLMDHADKIREEEGYPLECTETTTRKDSKRIVTALLKLYVKALDAARAESLQSQVISADLDSYFKSLVRTIVLKKATRSRTIPTIKVSEI